MMEHLVPVFHSTYVPIDGSSKLTSTPQPPSGSVHWRAVLPRAAFLRPIEFVTVMSPRGALARQSLTPS